MRQARSATHTPGNAPRPPRPNYLPPPPPPAFTPPPPPPSFAPPPPPKCSNSPLPSSVIGNSETVVYEQLKPVNGAHSQHELTHSDASTNDLTNSITTEDYESEGEDEATNGVECFYEEELELSLEKKPSIVVEEEVLEVTLPIKIDEVCTEDGSEDESSSDLSDSEDSEDEDSTTSSDVQPSVNIVEVTDLKECEGLATVEEFTVDEVEEEEEEEEEAEELEEDVVQPSYIDEPEELEITSEVTDQNEAIDPVEESAVEVVIEDNECDSSINKDDDVLEVKGQGDIREEASASPEEQNVEHEKVQEDTKPSKEFLKSIPVPKIPPFVKSEPPCDFREDPSTWIEWLETEVNTYKQEQAEKKRVKEQEQQVEQGQVPKEEITQTEVEEEEEEREGQQKSFVVSDEHQGQVDNSVVKEDQDLEKSETQNELAQDAVKDQREDQDKAENNKEEEEEEEGDWEWEDEEEEVNVNVKEVEEEEKQEMPIEITSELSQPEKDNEQENITKTDLESEINHEVESLPKEKDEVKEQTEETNDEDWEWEDENEEGEGVEDPTKEKEEEEEEIEIEIPVCNESAKDETEKEDDTKDEEAEETDNFVANDEADLSKQQSVQLRKHRVVKSNERESDPMEVIEKMRQMRQNRVLQRHVSADGNNPNSAAPAPPPFMRMHSNPGERSSRPSSICTEDSLDDMLGRVKKLREERQQILKDMARLKDAFGEEEDTNGQQNGMSSNDQPETTRRSSFDSGIGPSKSVTTEGSVTSSETTTIQTRKISHQSSEDSNVIYCFICDEELGNKLTKGNVMHMGLEDGEPICPEAFNLTEKSKEKIKNIALTKHLDLRAKYEFLETLDLDLLAGDDYELTSEDVLQKVESFLDNVEEQKKKDQEQFDLLRTGAINEIFAEEFFAASSLATSDYTEDFNAFQDDQDELTDQATSPMSETETKDEPHESIPPAPPAPPPPPPPLPKPDEHLKEARSELLNSIKSGIRPKLKSAITDDKSQVSEAGKVLHKHLAPRVFTREVRDLMHEIQNPKIKLKKTKTIDRSQPYIPQDIEIFFYAGPNADHKKLAPPPKSREIPSHKSPSPEPPQSRSKG